MTNPYATIRAALALVREPYGTAGHAELQIALAKLAELEKAASEPVMYQYLHPWGGEKIWREEPYWNGNISIVSRPLYAATQIPNTAAPQAQVAVSDEMCERVFTAYLNHGIFNGFSDTLKNGRAMIEVVQSELGPALGMTAWREPTEEECVKMCSILTDWEVRRNDGFSLSPQGITQAQEARGRAIFEAVREVMGGGE